MINLEQRIQASINFRNAQREYLLACGWVQVGNLYYPPENRGRVYPSEDNAVTLDTAVMAEQEQTYHDQVSGISHRDSWDERLGSFNE